MADVYYCGECGAEFTLPNRIIYGASGYCDACRGRFHKRVHKFTGAVRNAVEIGAMSYDDSDVNRTITAAVPEPTKEYACDRCGKHMGSRPTCSRGWSGVFCGDCNDKINREEQDAEHERTRSEALNRVDRYKKLL